MTNNEFITKLQDIEKNYKTVYMWGVFGSPVTESIINTKVKQFPNNYSIEKQKTLRNLIGKGYFAFDCVCLIKGILWGWNGNLSSTHGGAVYPTTAQVKAGVCPDETASGIFDRCTSKSTDFSKISIGEAVYKAGHIGVYIGNGKVIECTNSWNCCVMTTACLNICTIQGLQSNKWESHGKLPYITYESEKTASKLKVDTKIKYSGILYADSYGNKPGKKVSGNFIVNRVIPERKYGVLISNVGWVAEKDCEVV